MPRPKKPASPFRYFNSSPEIIRLVAMIYLRFPLSLRNDEDLLTERGTNIRHETVRLWWNRFGPLLAADIKRQRIGGTRGFRHWRWHVDEVFVKINGETHYLWRTTDHEGEILESYVTKKRDKSADVWLSSDRRLELAIPKDPGREFRMRVVHRWQRQLLRERGEEAPPKEGVFRRIKYL
jgi:hypothetical protein